MSTTPGIMEKSFDKENIDIDFILIDTGDGGQRMQFIERASKYLSPHGYRTVDMDDNDSDLGFTRL